ncbi:MAG: hypothetical protein Q9179_007775, partial [Wetmoreana sp. 5 TL-2023]
QSGSINRLLGRIRLPSAFDEAGNLSKRLPASASGSSDDSSQGRGKATTYFDKRVLVTRRNLAYQSGHVHSIKLRSTQQPSPLMTPTSAPARVAAQWGSTSSTLGTVNNLGNFYKAQGKMAEAEEMYMRALRGYEKAWGLEHTSTLGTVNNLGLLYADQGKMAEAEEMYIRVLAREGEGVGTRAYVDARHGQQSRQSL